MSSINWIRLIGLGRGTLRRGLQRGKTLEHYIKRKNISNNEIVVYFSSISNLL